MRTSRYLPVGRSPIPCDRDIVAALRRVMTAVNVTGSLEKTLGTILEACADGLGYLHSSLTLFDARGEYLVGRPVCSPRTTEAWRRVGLPTGDACYRRDATGNLVVRVFVEHSPHLTTRYHDLVQPHVAPDVAAQAQKALGIASIALLPLLEVDRCLGVLTITAAASHPLTAMELPALELFARQAAAAVENARLHRDLRASEQQVSLLVKGIIDAQEEERERICLEIHDGVAQTLAPAFQYLQALDGQTGIPETSRTNIRKAAMLVRNAIREAREVISSLRPAALDTVGLVSTLRNELEEIHLDTHWRIDFDADQARFSKEIETALYRILHEAINNVMKHADARQVMVRVKQKPDHILVEVQDDGVGFDVHAIESRCQPTGIGLLGMRKRAELLQGTFAVSSRPGQGTLVRVEVPTRINGAQRREPLLPVSTGQR